MAGGLSMPAFAAARQGLFRPGILLRTLGILFTLVCVYTGLVYRGYILADAAEPSLPDPPPQLPKPPQIDFGFSTFNSSAQIHPITRLVEKNRIKWVEKLQTQSKTLQQAVAEYRRRYHRYPPRGFERWYKFAKDHNIVLIDEYDKIYQDLAMFYGLAPSDVRKLQEKVGSRPTSRVSWIKMDKKEVTTEIYLPWFRVEPMKDWLVRLADVLGDAYLFFHLNINDEANSGQIPYQTRMALENAAREGKQISLSELDDIHAKLDNRLSSLARACPPNSPLVLHELDHGHDDYPPVPPDAAASFVDDPLAAGDPCNHPYLSSMHYSLSPHTLVDHNIKYPTPIFAFSKIKTESDIILPTLDQFRDPSDLDDPLVAWQLMQDRAVWRGSTKAGHWDEEYTALSRFKWNSERVRLRLLQSNQTGQCPLIWSNTSAIADDLFGEQRQEFGLNAAEIECKSLAEQYLDISFSDASQCENTCHLFEQPPYGPFQKMSIEDANKYRYVFDVDGNGWSGRFPRLLQSRQVVLKSTIIEEFNQDWRLPWVHYVPLSTSYAEVFNIMAYFTGRDGKGDHQEEAHRIAQQGRDWRIKFWRQAEQDVYLVRLLMEWQRVTSDARDTPEMEYRGEPDWDVSQQETNVHI